MAVYSLLTKPPLLNIDNLFVSESHMDAFANLRLSEIGKSCKLKKSVYLGIIATT